MTGAAAVTHRVPVVLRLCQVLPSTAAIERYLHARAHPKLFTQGFRVLWAITKYDSAPLCDKLIVMHIVEDFQYTRASCLSISL